MDARRPIRYWTSIKKGIPTDPPVVRDLARLAAGAVPLVSFCAALYFYLYWRRFAVEPFTFAGFSDFLPAAAPFLAVVLALTAILGILVFLFPPSEERAPSIDAAKARHVALFFLLADFGALAAYLLRPTIGEAWENNVFVASIAMGAVGARELLRITELREIFATPLARRIAAIALTYLPMYAIWIAATDSELILDGKGFLYTESVDLPSLPKELPPQRLTFLGKLGDRLVFSDSGFKSVYILKADTVPSLRLQKSRSGSQR